MTRRGETVGAPNSSVAVVSKVILDVQHKEIDKSWEQARRGETLASGDRVKTGEKSIAVVKFKDNWHLVGERLR